jgi:citronellol/citronellal dehydrogenase
MNLAGKTVFITGASRGIGLAIALRAARDGARIAIAAKTGTPHPHLPGTIHTAAEQIRSVGGTALPLIVDVRDESSVAAAVQKTVDTFGGIDICINNASAISPTSTLDTSMKKFDLMHQVNARGTFMVSRACVPHLKHALNPHVLNIAPPLNLDRSWLGPHIGYTLSKYGMSLCALGMAAEFIQDGIAFNGLWPISTIDTSAVRFALGGDGLARSSRTAEIMADAAYVVLNKPSRHYTGQLLLDELVLRDQGQTDFSRYAVDPTAVLCADAYVSQTDLAKTPIEFTEDLQL